MNTPIIIDRWTENESELRFVAKYFLYSSFVIPYLANTISRYLIQRVTTTKIEKTIGDLVVKNTQKSIDNEICV